MFEVPAGGRDATHPRTVDEAKRLTNPLHRFSGEQFGGKMSYGMMLAIVDVTGRVVLCRSWGCLKNCRQLSTEENAGIAKLFRGDCRGGGGRGDLVLEVECRSVAGADGSGRGFSLLAG